VNPTSEANLIEILQCLEKHGERLDSQIAEETGVPLAAVRERAAGLAATGALITCSVTRFTNGDRVDAWLYRRSGYIPPAAPGRKAKPKSA
jgi:transcription initiation factor IIE alpha subunit